MLKLHVQTNDGWQPVFCINDGKLITCNNHPKKALPSLAIHGKSDLEYFVNRFLDMKFELRKTNLKRSK